MLTCMRNLLLAYQTRKVLLELCMYIIFSDVMLYSADCNDSDIRLMGGPSMWAGSCRDLPE